MMYDSDDKSTTVYEDIEKMTLSHLACARTELINHDFLRVTVILLKKIENFFRQTKIYPQTQDHDDLEELIFELASDVDGIILITDGFLVDIGNSDYASPAIFANAHFQHGEYCAMDIYAKESDKFIFHEFQPAPIWKLVKKGVQNSAHSSHTGSYIPSIFPFIFASREFAGNAYVEEEDEYMSLPVAESHITQEHNKHNKHNCMISKEQLHRTNLVCIM